MDSLTPVTLVVKAPNQKIGDLTVECALDWTVKQLKQHLSSVYPSKPAEKQQRIIYSGRLLQDDVQLKDVLRQYEPDQQTHTVHLVCSPSTTDSSHSPPFPASQQTETSANMNSSTTGLRQRHTAMNQQLPLPPTYSSVMSSGLQYSLPNPVMYPAAAMMPGAAAGMMPGQGFISPMYTPEQFMWMQQNYVQYMAQYMQYYQPGFYQHQVTIPPSEPVPNVPDNHQAVNAPRAEAAANERPRPEIVRMNAQGGPLANDDEDEDEMRNRDWLDWVYVFVRFLLLLCILYFYSSFDRFLATTVLIVVIYLYQAGWFRLNQRNPAGVAQRDAAARAVQEPRQPQINDDRHPQANDDAAQAAAVDDVNDGVMHPAAAEADPEADGHGILSLSWTFIVSFFSSLAPQQPPPVNAN